VVKKLHANTTSVSLMRMYVFRPLAGRADSIGRDGSLVHVVARPRSRRLDLLDGCHLLGLHLGRVLGRRSERFVGRRALPSDRQVLGVFVDPGQLLLSWSQVSTGSVVLLAREEEDGKKGDERRGMEGSSDQPWP
jgi:hypothetical protein